MKKTILTVAVATLATTAAFSQNHVYDNHWGGLYSAPTTRHIGVGQYYANQPDPNDTKVSEHQLELNSWSTNTVLGNNTTSALRINNNTWSYNALSEIQFGINNDPKHVLSSISSLYKSYGASAGGELIFSTSPNATNGVLERMRITQDGHMITPMGVNVGLGTSDPEAKLEVFGGDIVIGGQHKKFLIHTQHWDPNSNSLNIIPKNLIGGEEDWDFDNQFIFGADGNFDVHGTVYAEEIIVQLAPFPDYVFEKEYHLMGLNELDEYISKNGHLPNIPSAEEIEEENIGLGELQRLQMEKIEELTLYVLQLRNEIEELKSQKLK